MPIILAQVLRTLVMALVTGGGIAAIESFFSDSMKNIVSAIQNGTGISEQDAKDLVVNFLIDTAENTGITFLLLKVRLPVKIADYLGITNKTVAKKAITPAATKATQKLASSAGGSIMKSTVAKIVSAAAIPASLIWLVNALANTIEPGIYKPEQTNAVYRSLGIPFQYPVSAGALQPGPFDGPGFSEYAKALETQGIFAINNPGAMASVVYSRQALADLINYVYGQEIVKGNAISKAKLIPLLAPYLRTKGTATPAAASLPASGVAAATYTPVKVFTGILSQGTLGVFQPFTAREDDLINSADELQDVAQTNAASFLAALPGRIQHELRIVNSVVAADGSKRVGTTQRVQVGTLKSGQARYKFVTNKFDVLDLFYSRREGTRTKIASITLGPTDVARFNPSPGDLAGVGNALRSLVATSQVSDILQVMSPQPLTVSMVEPSRAAAETPSVAPTFIAQNDTGYRYYSLNMNGDNLVEVLPWTGNVPDGHVPITKEGAIAMLRSLSVNPRYKGSEAITTMLNDILGGRYDGPSGYVMQGDTPMRYDQTARALARNLAEFYAAMSLPLPSVSERGQIYQSLGLGAASLYTGTVEQNTKLLIKLQGKS